MITRTPMKNALISLVPFYGISSYWYLGRKLGSITFVICFYIGILPGIILFASLSRKISNDFWLIIILFNLACYIVQFYIVWSFTKEAKIKECDKK